jgi:hypothetical protein
VVVSASSSSGGKRRWGYVYFLVDVYDDIVASVRHCDDAGSDFGDERACWSAARLRLTSRDASVRRVIRSRGRQGPACDWSDEVVKIATTNVSASRTRHDNHRMDQTHIHG